MKRSNPTQNDPEEPSMDESKKKNAFSFSAYFHSFVRSSSTKDLLVTVSVIGLIFIFSFFAYHLIVFIRDLVSTSPRYTYEAKSNILRIKNAPATNAETVANILRVPNTHPEVLHLSSPSEHMEEVNTKLASHYKQIQQSRPPLIASPPDERDLPYQSLLSVIESWNPDIPDVPETFHETIQIFNYGNEYERSLAEAYRNAEIPFKLYNVTDFNEISQKWHDGYLIEGLNAMTSNTHAEKSKNNHFMFWSTRGGARSPAQYKPPTEIVNLRYEDWLIKAKIADIEKLNASSEHYYYMVGTPPRDSPSANHFVSKDLQLFSTRTNNFFITNVNVNKGIQCRFGMRGIIAETHYDSGKNMIAMLRGRKRYILTPPWSCPNLGIISDNHHPSFRHSIIDWSDISQAKANKFDKVDAIDTIVNMGEVLYIPSFWFHYIISLEYSIQCNSRSGFPTGKKGVNYINECLHYTLK